MIKKLHNLLIKNGLTISTAESCTGGMLAEMLTRTAGSSAYYPGSIVCYSNKVKQNLLGVSPTLLQKHGAVSAEVVQAMLDGIKTLFDTDIICAISGIAGPDGGSESKPIGTVYIGVGIKMKEIIQQYQFKGTRSQIRKLACKYAIQMILDYWSVNEKHTHLG